MKGFAVFKICYHPLMTIMNYIRMFGSSAEDSKHSIKPVNILSIISNFHENQKDFNN